MNKSNLNFIIFSIQIAIRNAYEYRLEHLYLWVFIGSFYGYTLMVVIPRSV